MASELSYPFKVLTIDPGKTTGYVSAHFDEERIEVDYWESSFTHKEFYHFLQDEEADVIVFETFENWGVPYTDYYPVELIGIIRLYCQLEAPKTVIYPQKPSTGSFYWNNTKLKEIGLYKEGVHHGRQAMNHFMQWVEFGPGFKYRKGKELKLANY